MSLTMLEPTDLELIRASQSGLSIEPAPYKRLAAQLDTTQADVLARLQAMLRRGLIRRIGIVPNHYALGYIANGMCVWNLLDDHVDQAGQLLGALPDVSHCYRRPRRLPQWPYNLFTMLHGQDHDRVRAQAAELAQLLHNALPGSLQEHDVLFSTAILKKTGLRLGSD